MPMSTEQSLDALVKLENQKLKVLTEIRMTLDSILEKIPGGDFGITDHATKLMNQYKGVILDEK